VKLRKPKADSRLGITLKGTTQTAPTILQLAAGCIAAESGEVHPGQLLVAVNGEAILGHEHGSTVLRAAVGVIRLTLSSNIYDISLSSQPPSPSAEAAPPAPPAPSAPRPKNAKGKGGKGKGAPPAAEADDDSEEEGAFAASLRRRDDEDEDEDSDDPDYEPPARAAKGGGKAKAAPLAANDLRHQLADKRGKGKGGEAPGEAPAAEEASFDWEAEALLAESNVGMQALIASTAETPAAAAGAAAFDAALDDAAKPYVCLSLTPTGSTSLLTAISIELPSADLAPGGAKGAKGKGAAKGKGYSSAGGGGKGAGKGGGGAKGGKGEAAAAKGGGGKGGGKGGKGGRGVRSYA